jgi:hypothetical protein
VSRAGSGIAIEAAGDRCLEKLPASIGVSADSLATVQEFAALAARRLALVLEMNAGRGSVSV